jgi:hypothetical protein
MVEPYVLCFRNSAAFFLMFLPDRIYRIHMIPGNPVNPANHVESGSCEAALAKGTAESRLAATFHRRDMAESEPHLATGGVGAAQGKLGPVSTSCPETEPRGSVRQV